MTRHLILSIGVLGACLLVYALVGVFFPRHTVPGEADALTWSHDRDGREIQVTSGAQLWGRTSRGADTQRDDRVGGNEMPTTRILGRVVDDASGEGVGNAVVFAVTAFGPEDARQAHGPFATRANGSFSLRGIPAGTWMILPFHRGYAHPFTSAMFSGPPTEETAWLETKEGVWAQARDQGLVVDIASPPHPVGDLEIRMARGEPVEGVVLGPRGQPVADVPIRARVPRQGRWFQVGRDAPAALRRLTLATTDADGRFAIHCLGVEARLIELAAQHDSWIGQWTRVLPGHVGNATELRLDEACRVDGGVEDRGGDPVEGATLRLLDEDDWLLPTGTPTTRTSQGGGFVLMGLPPGNIRLSLREGRDRTTSTVEDLRGGEHRRDIQLVLRKKGRLAGTLTDAAGQPLEDEVIQAVPHRKDPYAIHLSGDMELTDTDGAFLLGVRGDVSFDLWLITGDRRELLLEAVQHPQKDLRLTATQTRFQTLRVRAIDPQGHPIPQFEAECGPLTHANDNSEDAEDGVAVIKAQGTPPYVIRVQNFRDARGQPLPYAGTARILALGEGGDIDIRVRKRAEFLGRVRDLEGAPVPGAVVVVTEQGVEREISVDADGHFRFEAAHEETHEVEGQRIVLPPGYREHTYFLDLEAGLFADLVVQGGCVPLGGRVVLEGADPEPMGGLKVRLSWTSLDDEGVEVVDVRPDGRFLAHAVPKDVDVTVELLPWLVQARGWALAEDARVVRAGATDVTLRVKPGLRIQGHVRGPGVADLPPSDVRVVLLGLGGWTGGYRNTPPSADDPSFRIDGLSTGPWRIGIFDMDRRRLLGWAEVTENAADRTVIHMPALRGRLTADVVLHRIPGIEHSDVTIHTLGASHGHLIHLNLGSSSRLDVDGLDAEKTYRIHATVATEFGTWVALSPPVRPGQHIRLIPVPGQGLRGRLVGAADMDAIQAILLRREGIQEVTFPEDDGTFEFEGLLGGAYELSVLGPDLKVIHTVPGVTAGSKNVVVRLP